jgi:pectin methylesterase-like acyl-CoA thioesterase
MICAKKLLLLLIATCGFVAATTAQSLINVKLAGDNPGVPTGAAVVGAAGDSWNYFPNLTGRASGGGVVTNATIIKDSAGATLAGVTMTMSLSAGDGLDPWTDNTSFSPVPQLIMGTYVFEITGTYYFTFNFTGLQPNRTYLLYGMGNGNVSGQGTTWWVDTANGHATASASANFLNGSRNATLASNEGICWVKVPATTTASGTLTFRVVRLGAAENGTGGSGRAYLNAFQLQSLAAPVTAGLTNQTAIAGTTVALSPVISGTPPPSFQWRSNGTNLVGATNASLSLPNVQYSQNGFVYSLVASNLIGATTNSMVLTVLVTPMISGLTNQAAAVGADVALAATINGVPPPTLQWQKNGANIGGATTASYLITNAQEADSGNYSLVASNSAGLTTNSMILTVSSGNVSPSITGPTDQTVIQTSNAVFMASASGLPLPTLQWRLNGVNLVGQIGGSLTVSNVQYSQNGQVYSVVASNLAGLATNSATLFVLVPPTISASPTNLVVTNTQSATFSVTASGVPAPAYQWFYNNNPIPGATASSHVIAAASPANNGNYFVVVSNSVGSVTSAVASLTVNSTMAAMALTPSNGTTGICYDTPLQINFSAAPRLRTAGKIRIYNANNTNSPVDTIDLSLCLTNDANYAANIQPYTIGGNTFNAFPVIITGNTASLYPHHGVLTSNQTYYVTVDNGTFTDSAGAYFAGISATNAWRFTTKPTGPANSTNLIVAPDHSGDFATVQGAVNFVPNGNTTPRNISIRDGVYREIVNINSRHNLNLRGQSRSGTVVGYPNNNSANPGAPWRACFVVNGNDCTLQTLTLTNMTPKGGGQAEAVDVEGTRTIFYNLNLASYQDTFLIHSSGKLVYFQDCLIQGDTDFMWGYGTVYITNSEIRALTAGAHVTQPRSPLGSNGFAFVDCRVTKGFASGTFTLGRTISTPTSPSQVLFMRCRMDDAVTGYGSDAGTNMTDYVCSNLTATAVKTLQNSRHLTGSDPWVVAAQSAPTWLYGWQPRVAPSILSQPTNRIANAGSSTSFSVTAAGVPNPTYQWRKNGINIVNATNALLTLASVNLTDNATFSVLVSSSAGIVTSSNATLIVPAQAATITPSVASGGLSLTWPPEQTGFRLFAQTNPPGIGLTTNWKPIASSNATNQMTFPMNTTSGSVFFRLVYP